METDSKREILRDFKITKRDFKRESMFRILKLMNVFSLLCNLSLDFFFKKLESLRRISIIGY